MPFKNSPPDWFLYISSMLVTAFSGAAGAFIRQLGKPPRKWSERMTGWIGGAISAVYFTPVLAPVFYHLMERFDLISPDAGLTPETITGLTGFLSGAVGMTVIERLISYIRNFRRHR